MTGPLRANKRASQPLLNGYRQPIVVIVTDSTAVSKPGKLSGKPRHRPYLLPDQSFSSTARSHQKCGSFANLLQKLL